MGDESQKKDKTDWYTETELKLYPERKSGKYEYSFLDKMFYGSEGELYTKLCEMRIVQAFKNNPMVRTLVGALKKHGCPINLRRHIVCENCERTIAGGFDSELNQVVICKNILVSKGDPERVLVHELIHMYDYCVNEINFRNLEHLACTEIRAANLTDCGFINSLAMGESSLRKLKQTHQLIVWAENANSRRTTAAKKSQMTWAHKYSHNHFHNISSEGTVNTHPVFPPRHAPMECMQRPPSSAMRDQHTDL